jgi:heat-inducible transcriptional repressor
VLRAVIREYLLSGEPVGSASLCERYDLGVSSATVRNDLADLADDGLLIQPHTSAGRVPTKSGYRLYVEEFVRTSELAERQRHAIMLALRAFEYQRDRAARAFARMVAEMTGETVVLRYGEDGQTLLSGLSNLASKPESRFGTVVEDLTRAIDEIEETMDEVRRRIDHVSQVGKAEEGEASRPLTGDVAVLIGEDNPFGGELSGVFANLTVPGVGDTTIGVVGPQRMDYERNIALIRFLKSQELLKLQ